MAHGRKVLSLPALDVQYADMVTDQETGSRGLVDLLGRAWEPRCLAFHVTVRSLEPLGRALRPIRA